MGFLVTARVESVVQFDEFNRAIAVSVNKALVEWGLIALEEVRAGAPVGTDIRGPGPHFRQPNDSGPVHLADSFQVATIPSLFGIGLANLIDVIVYSDDPVAVWQELGTRGRRRRKLKAGGRNKTEGNRGIRGKFFIRDGMARALPQGIALVQAAVEGVGRFDPGKPKFDTTATSNLGWIAHIRGQGRRR